MSSRSEKEFQVYVNKFYDLDPQDRDLLGVPCFDNRDSCSQNHKKGTVCHHCRWNCCQICGAPSQTFGGWSLVCCGSASNIPQVPQEWKDRIADMMLGIAGNDAAAAPQKADGEGNDAEMGSAAPQKPIPSFSLASWGKPRRKPVCPPAYPFPTDVPVNDPPPSPSSPPAVAEEPAPPPAVGLDEAEVPKPWENTQDLDTPTTPVIFKESQKPEDRRIEELRNLFAELDRLRTKSDSFVSFFVVTSVRRVENYHQLLRFKLCKQLCIRRNERRPEQDRVPLDRIVRIMCHGTNLASAIEIAINGLIFTRTTNHIYGKGVYFSRDNIRNAVTYALKNQDPAIVFGDGVVGKASHIRDSEQDKPNPGDDSGDNGTDAVAVLFDKDAFLPKYIVTIRSALEREWKQQLDAINTHYKRWSKQPAQKKPEQPVVIDLTFNVNVTISGGEGSSKGSVQSTKNAGEGSSKGRALSAKGSGSGRTGAKRTMLVKKIKKITFLPPKPPSTEEKPAPVKKAKRATSPGYSPTSPQYRTSSEDTTTEEEKDDSDDEDYTPTGKK